MKIEFDIEGAGVVFCRVNGPLNQHLPKIGSSTSAASVRFKESKECPELRVENHWHALTRENALDDLNWQERALTVSILNTMSVAEPVGEALDRPEHTSTVRSGREPRDG